MRLGKTTNQQAVVCFALGFHYICKNIRLMSNFTKQLDEKKDTKEREKTSRETLGKFFYDLAKLVFASMALVGGVSLIINDPQIHQMILLILGICFTFLLAYIGYKILNRR